MAKVGSVEKLQLHEYFVDGKTDQEISAMVGRVPSTILYHRKIWEKEGRPLPPTRTAPPEPETPEPEVTLEQAGPPENGVQPDPQTEPVQQTDPAPAPIATAKPEAAQSATKPFWNEPTPQRRTLQEGEWYEGAVSVIGADYVLIDLVELADDTGRSPRGILHRTATAGGENPANRYRLEELVQVRVVHKEFDPVKRRMKITLSTQTEQTEVPLNPPARENPPARRELPPLAAPVRQPAPAVLESYPPAVEHPLSYRPSPNLCDTCAHQRVCPVLELLAHALSTADIGPRYNDLKIKTRPLQMAECEEYRVEGVG